MADAADAAGDEQEVQERLLLRRHQERAAQHREVLGVCTGKCLNCDEPIEVGRFCDKHCQADYERRVSAHSRR